MTESNYPKEAVNFNRLNTFLTDAIEPASLAKLFEEIGYYYSVLLIENPDKIPSAEASTQVFYLREIRLFLQKMPLVSRTEVDLGEIKEFLSKQIDPSDLAHCFEELVFNYSVLLIENSDRVDEKSSVNQLTMLKDFSLIIKKLTVEGESRLMKAS